MALIVSAGALGGLVAATYQPTDEPSLTAEIRPAPDGESVGAIAAPTEAATPSEPSGIEPSEPSEPLGIVPSFEGMTASRAWRTARQLGLRAAIRDEDGYRVSRDEGPYLRVLDGQVPAAGSPAEPGSAVRLVARYPRRRFASGY